MKINILVTLNDASLEQNSLLVFNSIRTGFPNGWLCVYGNNLEIKFSNHVRKITERLKGEYIQLGETSHDQWIEWLISDGIAPFWIVDTDVIFHANMQNEISDKALLGRYEPEFKEPWTNTIRVHRLHTCVMRISPMRLNQQLKHWLAELHPKGFPFTIGSEFIQQHYVPTANVPLFYDTLAGAYNAIGGEAFSEEVNTKFDHLNCGTYANAIESVLPGINAQHAELRSLQNLAAVREQQRNFYIKYGTR